MPGPEDVEAAARRAHRQAPTAPEPLWTLNELFQLQGRYDEALAFADDLLSRHPTLGLAWTMRGDALANSGRPRDAIPAYERALDDPAMAFDALIRLGKMNRVLGQTDQALAFFDRAARSRPDEALPVYERGLLRLSNGDFTGWTDYAARWRTADVNATRGFVPPALIPHLTLTPTVDDLAGKRILLIGDQGIGDQLMFASILPDLARTAQSVLCLCEPRLLGLLQNAFPDITFTNPSGAQVDSDTIDVLLPMTSLGAAFRRATPDFPGTPFVAAQAEGVKRWEAVLGPRPAGLRIGLSWRGGVPQTNRTARSIALETLRPILDLPGAQVVSLQYGDVTAEIEAMNADLATSIRHFPADALSDFQDFADLIGALDVVVSVQNATVHLAGALGKPCLALLPQNAEWRYMRQRPRMPWYSSVELLRQPTPADWPAVITEVASRLATRSVG